MNPIIADIIYFCILYIVIKYGFPYVDMIIRKLADLIALVEKRLIR